MSYNDTDRQVKYAIENGFRGSQSRLGAIDKNTYDIQKDVDIISQICVCIGVASVISVLLNLFMFIMMVKIVMSM